MAWKKKSDILALMVGHGLSLDNTWDCGCTYGKYTEADLMYKIVKVAVNILRRSGVRVLTDADEKNNRNMKSSVAWANRKKAKMYISVHCDYSQATRGVAPLYKSATGKKIATELAKYVSKRMGMKYKGVFKRTDLFELNATNMPAVILETGAIKADLKYLKDYKGYGRALALAILKYLDVPYISARAYKIAKKANELAYAGHPDEAKYKGGKPKAEYKKALDKVYPNRKSWRKAARLGASCDVFMGTTVRASGVDENFPRGLGSQIPYLEKSKKFKRVTASVKNLRDGDIIVYKRPNGGGHICTYVGGKIKHAAIERWYGRTTNNESAIMSTKGKSWVRVYRAK